MTSVSCARTVCVVIAVFALTGFNRYLPCSIEVYILNPVVAPATVDRGAEKPVAGLLQSSEAVLEETLKARLSGF